MQVPDAALIHRVAQNLRATPGLPGTKGVGSLLFSAAGSFGVRGHLDDEHFDEVTQPTGFDPDAARLFEAIIESAFVVAHADGHFDEAERLAFQHVVAEACAGIVEQQKLEGLLLDLADQLAEDGLEKRLQMVGRTVAGPEQAREVLRVAALVAHVSGGVSPVERQVMERLAKEIGADDEALESALSDATRVLAP